MLGESFIVCAGNYEFFKNECKLPIGIAIVLANLSSELAEEEENSKLPFFMLCKQFV